MSEYSPLERLLGLSYKGDVSSEADNIVRGLTYLLDSLDGTDHGYLGKRLWYCHLQYCVVQPQSEVMSLSLGYSSFDAVRVDVENFHKRYGFRKVGSIRWAEINDTLVSIPSTGRGDSQERRRRIDNEV